MTLIERERGQVLPLVALLLVAAGVAMLLLGRLGGAAVARAQARTAADAAALAGAVAGKAEAVSVAAANGARLVRFEARGNEAWAKVVLGQAQATARARASRSAGPPTGAAAAAIPARPGLVPAMQGALARATRLLGRPVPITSGYRSRSEQAALFARRSANPFPVAPPGFSAHERGMAIDVPRSFVPFLLSVSQQVGLCHPYPVADPVHFELCR
jgi:hypothetical protein